VYIELIEALRCPREHEESPLVATASRTDARHIVEGVLGCPVCRAEYPIRDGEALFGGDAVREAVSADTVVGMRIAAFLELTEARGFAILCGHWAAHAEEVRQLSATPLVLINPPGRVDVRATGVVRVRGRAPVAARSARAAAVDESGDDALIASVVAAVRPKGRIIGAATFAVPEGVTELTRDDRTWIGEKSAAPEDPAPRLIALRKA
jgi:uncharacterized protein YbaR (Trm112 family)